MSVRQCKELVMGDEQAKSKREWAPQVTSSSPVNQKIRSCLSRGRLLILYLAFPFRWEIANIYQNCSVSIELIPQGRLVLCLGLTCHLDWELLASSILVLALL
jgi:hypothetical protein